MFKNYIITFIVLSSFSIVNAQTASTGYEEEANIYEKIYDAPLVISGDQQLSFHELYAGKPLLLALVFTRCTGVCYPFLVELSENLKIKDKSYNVLVLSFDPRDNAADMESMAKRLGLDKQKQWIFGTTRDIDKLNKSIGFTPIWDSLRSQYDHDALLVGINSDGYITKKLIGMRQGHVLDLLIASVNNIFSPTYRLPNKNSMFSCFNYDPKTGKNTPGLGLLFIALPAVLAVLILVITSYVVHKRPNNIHI